MKAISQLRVKGIKSELFPEAAKQKKQLNYANKRMIPFVVFAGASEIEGGEYKLKNMETGEQEICNLDALISIINQ